MSHSAKEVVNNKMIINVKISSLTVFAQTDIIGSAKSGRDVALRLHFSGEWCGFDVIEAQFTNNGKTVFQTLQRSAFEDDGTFLLTIPFEAKETAGDTLFTLKAVNLDGDVETKAHLTASHTFKVLESNWNDEAQHEQDVLPTEAERLQAEINRVDEKVDNIDIHPPMIQDGTWWIWDVQQNTYVDSGEPSQGDKGDKGDTGAQGEQGIQGEQGVQGEAGFSPVATVTQEDKVTHISITDKSGTTEADIDLGEVLDDAKDYADTKVENKGNPINIIIRPDTGGSLQLGGVGATTIGGVANYIFVPAGSEGMELKSETGSIAFNGAALANIADPTDAQEAATKHYVDDGNNNKIDKSDGTATGLLNSENQTVTGRLAVQNAAGNGGLFRGYTSSSSKGLMLRVIDDTDARPLTNTSGTEVLNCRKDSFNFIVPIYISSSVSGNVGIYLGGKRINNLGTPNADSDAANKKYVDDNFVKEANFEDEVVRIVERELDGLSQRISDLEYAVSRLQEEATAHGWNVE